MDDGESDGENTAKMERMEGQLALMQQQLSHQLQLSRLPVTVGSSMAMAPPPPQPVIGTGNFVYTMDIQVGPHGGDTIVNINANHNIDGIVPR